MARDNRGYRLDRLATHVLGRLELAERQQINRMVRLLGIVLLIASIPTAYHAQSGAGTSPSGARYKTYYNPRFEYSVSYPVDVLYPQGVAANGDGQKFLSRDGRTIMLVYGQENVRNQTFAEFYREESRGGSSQHPNRIVTYNVFKNNWFVVSGTDGGRIFYQKTVFRKDEFLTFSIEYDQSAKGTFDAITAVISRSFKSR